MAPLPEKQSLFIDRHYPLKCHSLSPRSLLSSRCHIHCDLAHPSIHLLANQGSYVIACYHPDFFKMEGGPVAFFPFAQRSFLSRNF